MLSLRIMATTDVHANILSYDYAGNRPYFGQGLAQTASLIAAARAEVPEALLFDNGDFLQGSALADLAAHDRRKRVHPVIAAFNALSEGMLAALQAELDVLAGDETARAGVIAAAGKAFCAGHDLKEMRAAPSVD